MNGDVHRPENSSRRYAAVLRISEAISACSDPQELATILADQLIDFLSFDHLDVVIFKEKSTEIEWHAWGKGPLPFPDLPIEELPEWDVYNSQEPLHIRDLSKDERFPLLKKLGAALGVDVGKYRLSDTRSPDDATPPIGCVRYRQRPRRYLQHR